MDDSQIVLFADFDSGNMARYERVFKSQSLPTTQSSSSITSNQPENKSKLAQSIDNSESNINNINNNEKSVLQQKFDVEFNVWTKPDCDETPVGPNTNRTWFYFGVKGGYGKFIKFNLMNLNRQGRLFEMGMLPVFRSIPGHEKWARIYSKPTWQNLESNFQMSFIHRLPDKRDSTTYFAFCFPHSYEECQKMLETYDKQFEYCKYLKPHNCEDDTIYYHRELICYSLDKKRIDLITISACNELSLKQEPRFDPDFLFPKIEANERCFSFDHKKVFILTSRVHPGETPASFVFNGFLEFILRKDDPRAKILRRQFVFKLIPMLNPDGVSRGHYRTDQLGCNLNRVYLDPDFDRHPSIYAVKSLIVFHHVNNRTSKEQDGLNFDKLFKLKYEDKEEEDEVKKEEEINKNHLTSRSFNSLSVNQPYQSGDLNNEIIDHNHYIHRSKSFALPLTNKNPDIIYNSLDINKLSIKDKEIKQKKLEVKNFEIGNENSDEDDNEFISEGLYASISNQPSKSIFSPHLNDPRLISINPLWSGIGFYVDLHGHAAKRGCFIYGNSIDNELYQIENVLFPKLISLNSQHFDFDGCNFSVKNMFMKDKREGLSKEGSGRVAMFKILGIIHSYTLECCYASGRVMNTIPPAINTSWTRGQLTGAISPPLHTDLPPKFLPEHYSDVGKAIAIAALDITEMNPHTRIPNSSFGNLEAIRNWIKFYIRSKNGGGLNQTNSSNQGFNSQSSANNVKKLVQKSSKHPVKSNSNTSNNISNNSKNNKFISKSLSQPKAKILPQRHSVAVDIISNEDDIFKRSKRTLTSINFKSSNFSLVEQNQSQLKANILKMKQIELNKSKSSPGLIRKTPSFSNRIEDEIKLNETPELTSSNELKVKIVHRKLMPITKQNLTNSNSNFQNKTTNHSNPNIVLFNKISNIEKTNTLNLNESQTQLNKSNILFDSPNQRKRTDSNRQKSANATKEILNIEPVKNETEIDTEFNLNDMNDLKQKNALIFQKIEKLELNNIQSQVDEDNLFININSKPSENNSNGKKKSQSFLFLKDKFKKVK